MSRFKRNFLKFISYLQIGYSYVCLRFTPWHKQRLARQFKDLNVDRLHVGCGDVVLPGWFNLTYEKGEYGRIKKVDGCWWLNYNVNDGLPIPDRSIQFLAGSHFIEHLDLNEGLRFFKEVFRVMKKGGGLRVSCPDMEIYAHHYVRRNKDFFENPLIHKACMFHNARTYGEIFAAKAYDSSGAHRWFYDFESLKHVLEASGFHQVKKCARLEGEMPDRERIELPEREIETLYVEAVKP